MPPPPLPRAASGLASAVADKAIEITTRQQTGVSYSDISRGVAEALRRGLTVVDYEVARKVCDEAHSRAEHGDGHSKRFCQACAAIYVAVNAAVNTYREVEE